jgi:hypothetical protein
MASYLRATRLASGVGTSSKNTNGQAYPLAGRIPGVVLGSDQPQQKLAVGDLLLLGSPELLVEDLDNLAQPQVLEQLFELFDHDFPPGLSFGSGSS